MRELGHLGVLWHGSSKGEQSVRSGGGGRWEGAGERKLCFYLESVKINGWRQTFKCRCLVKTFAHYLLIPYNVIVTSLSIRRHMFFS